jgi:hypothetical protein
MRLRPHQQAAEAAPATAEADAAWPCPSLILHGKTGTYQEDVPNSTRLLPVFARGVIPVTFCGTRCLTCCRCLPCLLASQTALTPPGKHWVSLVFTILTFPYIMEEPWRANLAASCSAC